MTREEQNTEYHMPGFNYMGPGTKIATRVMNKVRPTNALDAASLIHDVEYLKHKQFSADNNMYKNIVSHSITNIPIANYIRTSFLAKDLIGYELQTDPKLYELLKEKITEYKLLDGYETMNWLD